MNGPQHLARAKELLDEADRLHSDMPDSMVRMTEMSILANLAIAHSRVASVSFQVDEATGVWDDIVRSEQWEAVVGT